MKVENYFNNRVKFIEKDVFIDNRGYFLQGIDNCVQKEINFAIIQENLSFSKKNVLRGLHYQWNEPRGKIIQCINGEIIDIVVDIVQHSPTFGKVEFFSLNKPNSLLVVPAGFAHGFLSLTNDTLVKYLCNSQYNKLGESGINPLDKDLEIIKKLNLNIDNLIISDKDRNAGSFKEYLNQPKF